MRPLFSLLPAFTYAQNIVINPWLASNPLDVLLALLIICVHILPAVVYDHFIGLHRGGFTIISRLFGSNDLVMQSLQA